MLKKRIQPDVTDQLRKATPEEYLQFFGENYFEGRRNEDVVGYDDYAYCHRILCGWSEILEEYVQPTSLLDVGAAYGFVVEYFRNRGRRADGVEPSEFARGKAAVDLFDGHLPHGLPKLDRTYDVVSCTEVMEHMHPDSVADAFHALIQYGERLVVCLIEMGEWDEYHKDPSHIHLRPREWWLDEVKQLAGVQLDEELNQKLDAHPMSQGMGWSGRFVVLRLAG